MKKLLLYKSFAVSYALAFLALAWLFIGHRLSEQTLNLAACILLACSLLWLLNLSIKNKSRAATSVVWIVALLAVWWLLLGQATHDDIPNLIALVMAMIGMMFITGLHIYQEFKRWTLLCSAAATVFALVYYGDSLPHGAVPLTAGLTGFAWPLAVTVTISVLAVMLLRDDDLPGQRKESAE